MPCEHAYFLVTPKGKTDAILEKFMSDRKTAAAEQTRIQLDLKADGRYWNESSILGFMFNDLTKVPKGFYHKKGDPDTVFRPNQKTPEGKEMIDRLVRCIIPGAFDLTTRLNANLVQTRSAISGRMPMNAFSYERLLKKHKIILVPINMEGKPGWPKPPKDVKLIKNSEYWKLKEEHDAWKKKDDAKKARQEKKATEGA